MIQGSSGGIFNQSCNSTATRKIAFDRRKPQNVQKLVESAFKCLWFSKGIWVLSTLVFRELLSMPCPNILPKFSLYAAVFHTIYNQLEDQVCALNLHVQLEIQVREFLALASRQGGEQALRHRGQICLELADADEILVVCIWRIIVLACDEVVFHHERLARAEVAGVVE